MPTASQASAATGRANAVGPPPLRGAKVAPPLPERHPSHKTGTENWSAALRGVATGSGLVPKRRDSSIGATSSNPRLRSGSVIEAAAAANRVSSGSRTPIDFSSRESQESLRRLRRVFLPVIMRIVLRRRRRARWKGGRPPRRYTPESVVAAIMSTKSRLVDCPHRILESLADGATYHYLAPKEILVYANEPHVSCGIVVLLYGQLEEQRPELSTGKKSKGGGAARRVHTQPQRIHKANDVLCLMPVLCEDRATSFLTALEHEEADVAIISSRWFWEVFYDTMKVSLTAADGMVRALREVMLPCRKDIVQADYFPTSLVLLRSWMWPMLTPSDRVKLSRLMEVRVLSVGDTLFDEGEYDPYIYVVRRGALTVIVKGETLALLEAGAAMGEESVLFHDKRNSSVVAATVCEIYALHVRHLLHRFDKYREVGQRILAVALERQRRWMEAARTRDVFGLVSILSSLPCLVHTTDAVRGELALNATVVTVPQGHTLATMGTPCTFFCVIGRGAVNLKAPKSAPPAELSIGDCASGNSRGYAPVERRPGSSKKATVTPLPSPELLCETRGTGDFFGEMCFASHQWPSDVVCDTTVSLWQFDRAAVLKILERDHSDVQAVEVCRQGIALYRAQHGEESITEGFHVANTPHKVPSARRASASVARSRAPSADAASVLAARTRGSNVVGHLSRRSSFVQPSRRSSVAETPLAAEVRRHVSSSIGVDWSAEQWTDYALARIRDGVQSSGASDASGGPGRELRDVDKEVEKAMKEKVLQFVAVQPEGEPNPADCDISGSSGELQGIIVEQLFLTPTARQPRFLRQVNNSNVRLVTDEGDSPGVDTLDASVDLLERMDDLQSTEAPVAVNGVLRLEDVEGTPMEKDAFFAPHMLPSYPPRGATESGDANSARALSEARSPDAGHSGQAGWHMSMSSLGRGRQSGSFAACGDNSAIFGSSFNPRSSFNRSHFVRPHSGLPPSPRSSSVRDDALSPLTMGSHRPMSSSESRATPAMRTRPTSVDFHQFNGKLSLDRSTSVLDRYVKIEDQNYFDNYVKVLPLQQDELWMSDEVNANHDMSVGTMVLMLLHVQKCDYLAPEVLRRCARPIVKVTLGQRVLVRTSVMENRRSPRWSIERSSFISLVRRGVDVVFSVCDADDESRVVYRASLTTGNISEGGGVGQYVMSLAEVSEDGTVATQHTKSISGGPGDAQPMQDVKVPRLTTTMLTATAAKYKALRLHLETREERANTAAISTIPVTTSPTAPDTTALFLQVMSVEGLQHRIEAAVNVSWYNGDTSLALLTTERVLPKTRSPAWTGEKSFVKVFGDGGVLTFDLLHRGTVISSAEATVDELIFGGVGVRRLPLLQAQTGNVVIGQLVISVLGARVGNAVESCHRDWATHLAVEGLALSRGTFAINPDPFVVLRDGAGTELMRTPLACGTYEASWTTAEASCLLRCPLLSGSSVSYQLEVCDSDDLEVIGRATIVLTERGIGPGHRHELPISPPGRGVVWLRSLCLPIQDLLPLDAPQNDTTARRATSSPPTSAATLLPAPARPATLDELSSPLLLLLHMEGCKNLPSGAAAELQTDAVGTLAIDGRRYMQTSIKVGTTAPRWPMSRASVLLRVPPQLAAENEEAEQQAMTIKGDVRLSYQQHECIFTIYDGVIDEVSRIGQVAVPLSQLLTSAHHSYPLFPKQDGAESTSSDRPSAENGMTLWRRAVERTVGRIHVVTLCGHLDHPVRTTVDRGLDALLFMPALGQHPPLYTLPYYNPGSAVGAEMASPFRTSRATQLTANTVVISLSSICHVLPNATAKCIRLVVRHGDAVLLSTERELGATSHAEWSVTEVSAVVPNSVLTADTGLFVDLTARNIAEGRSADTEDAAVGEAPPPKASRRRPSSDCADSSGNVHLGRAELHPSQLASVGVGEIRIVAVSLTTLCRPSSGLSASGRGPATVVVPSTANTAAATALVPTVSFGVFGSRA